MNEKLRADLTKLAEQVVILCAEAEESAVQLLAHEAAVLSLIATHPDPERFAAEFRRRWQLFGSQHSVSERGAETLDRIGACLSQIEQACPVPLGVRPGK